MKAKKIVIVILDVVVLISAIVLVNLYLGCQDSVARSQMPFLERENTRLIMQTEQQQKEMDELKKDIEKLKESKQK